MKKTILLVLLIVMTLTITGCGKKSDVVIYSSQEEERDQALKEQLNVEIDKKKIITDVIKQEGIYTVDLKLLEGIVAKIKVHIKAN